MYPGRNCSGSHQGAKEDGHDEDRAHEQAEEERDSAVCGLEEPAEVQAVENDESHVGQRIAKMAGHRAWGRSACTRNSTTNIFYPGICQ